MFYLEKLACFSLALEICSAFVFGLTPLYSQKPVFLDIFLGINVEKGLGDLTGIKREDPQRGASESGGSPLLQHAGYLHSKPCTRYIYTGIYINIHIL